MRERPRHTDVKVIGKIQEDTLKIRLEVTKKSTPFTMGELDQVLKSLKSGKSKDSNGYICELFKDGVIGGDLKASSILMFNHMKDELIILHNLQFYTRKTVEWISIIGGAYLCAIF